MDKEHLSSLASTSLPIAEDNASGSTEERRVHEISKTRKREGGSLIASKISSTWLEVRKVCGTISCSRFLAACERRPVFIEVSDTLHYGSIPI